MKKKKIAYISVAVVAALVLLTLGAGWFMLDYALKPDEGRRDTTAFYKQMRQEYPWTTPWLDSLKHAGALRDTFITTLDGERHHALSQSLVYYTLSPSVTQDFFI